jgi:AraC-like DNA-binding protein
MGIHVYYFSFFVASSSIWDTYTPDSIWIGMEYITRTVFFGGISILGLVLSSYIILSYRRNETYFIFLGIFTLTTALILLELVCYWWETINYSPKVAFYNSLIFLWGPSLHLYLKRKVHDGNIQASLSKTLRHYAIFVISLALLAIAANIDIDAETSKYGPSWLVLTLLTNNWVKSVYASFYLIVMIREYYSYQDTIDQLAKKWAQLLISYFAFLLVIKIFRAEFDSVYAYNFLSKYLAAYYFSTFILILGFLTILFGKTDVLHNKKKEIFEEKYKNSGLTQTMLLSLKEQLVKVMEVDKLFLDHKLTLQTLAEALNTDRYSLSQLINQEFNKNFYEFINDYRINESVTIIKRNPERVQLVADLTYESGFNNKVSFYRAFKKRKQITPAKYIKEYAVIA